MIVFSYGGGRQTIAMCIMIDKGVLPMPDVVVMADTGRENQMTWDYLEKYTAPLLKKNGLEVEIAGKELATVDLYGHNGDLLLPAYTTGGKLSGFCSNEWKKRVRNRYLQKAYPDSRGTIWLGLAHDERRRWAKIKDTAEHRWIIECPLVDKMINTDSCLAIIKAFGWPEPTPSSCWMCPHKRNSEWRALKEQAPEQFAKAVELEKKLTNEDHRGGIWFHRSIVPLDQVDFSEDESRDVVRQCSLGMCFV